MNTGKNLKEKKWQNKCFFYRNQLFNKGEAAAEIDIILTQREICTSILCFWAIRSWSMKLPYGTYLWLRIWKGLYVFKIKTVYILIGNGYILEKDICINTCAFKTTFVRAQEM